MQDREQLFRSWMADHGPAVRRIVASYAGPRTDQEDLAQDVAIAIWQAMPGFRGEASPRTFLFRIAHYRGVTHLARRKPAPPCSEQIEIADGAPGPEVQASDRQEVARLFVALRALPVPQRQVLTLALEGLSHKEIGECLGTSPENVAVRLNRARAALRTSMEERHG